jgi:N-acylneuraminate cytidylyltransferase
MSYGAKISWRPPEMAMDHSPSEEAILHFAERVDFDWLVFIQTTSPLLTVSDIYRGLEMMKSGKYDSVFTATREHWLPRWTLDVQPENWNPNNRPPRQLMPEKYAENGAFYITTKENLMKSGCRYSGRIGVVEIPLIRSFQIDTTEDLELIELLIKNGVHNCV